MEKKVEIIESIWDKEFWHGNKSAYVVKNGSSYDVVNGEGLTLAKKVSKKEAYKKLTDDGYEKIKRY